MTGPITEQTIAGAISTGTHGSGRHSLSHYVQSVRVACYNTETGQAEIREFSAGDELRAARCSLGLLGVILSVTMQCRQSYHVEEHFREYKEVADVVQAEEEFPLQQFYLVPHPAFNLASGGESVGNVVGWNKFEA
jgi:FAD/FMN-containing dehydrogenase